MSVVLRVGAFDLGAKDLVVLRSLIQVLDGQTSCQLRFHDDADACAVVFVPADWQRRLPASCITVRVAEADAEVSADDADGFVVWKPLRLPQVLAVLEVASDLIAHSTQAAAAEGVRAVYLALARHVMSRERRVTALRLSDGNRLVVEFAKGLVHSTMTRAQLLAGLYVMEPAQRAQPGEQDLFDRARAWPLRELVWELAVHLGDAGVEGSDFKAAYQLAQRPVAGLPARPEYGRLAMLLQARPLTLAEACRLSGATRAQVQWFLETGLAMGLVTAVGERAAPGAEQADEAPAEKPLLGRIVERLKVW